MFLTLDRWYSPETIFDLATICYVRRERDDDIERKIAEKKAEYEEKYGARIIPIELDAIEISSSDIRALLNDPELARRHLSKPVYDYVIEKGLYK